MIEFDNNEYLGTNHLLQFLDCFYKELYTILNILWASLTRTIS